MQRDEFIQKLFDRARERAGNAPDFACEASYSASSEFEVNVLNGEILKYGVSDSGGLGFRVLVNGKMGYASTQILDEDAIDLLVDGALENAALVESKDEQFIFEGSPEYPRLKLFNADLEALDAARKIEMAKELERLTLAQDPRIDRLEDCGVFSACEESGIVNSKGLNVSVKGNLLGGYAVPIAKEGEKVNSGFKVFFVLDPAGIDLERTAKEAADEAIAGLNGAPVPSAGYRVLLRRDVAATLLATFSGVFSADNAQRGLSRLKGREGEAVAAPCVTILDDPHRPDSASSRPFDGEGVATVVKAVVEDGRLNTLLHNLKTAKKQGVATTANASRPGYAAPVGVAPSNFYFKPGGQDFDAMLAALDDGLLITDLQGMHAGANPSTGDFSLAAKGFRVRGGRAAEPVAQITVAGNFYDLLRDVEAVGSDLEFQPPGNSCFGSPSLLVKALSVAGE